MYITLFVQGNYNYMRDLIFRCIILKLKYERHSEEGRNLANYWPYYIHLNILWICKSNRTNAKMFPQGYLALILQVFTCNNNCIVSFATGTLFLVLCVSMGLYPHPMRSSWSAEYSYPCCVVAVMQLLRPSFLFLVTHSENIFLELF